eukprot:5048136-Alexandrium_andersonii.AAC.1
MTAREMQHVMQLARICRLEAGVANRVTFDAVIERLEAEGSGLPGTSALAPLFEFVTAQGGVDNCGPIA